MMLKSVGEFIAKGITIGLCTFERRVLKREPKNLKQKCFIASIVLMFFMLLGGAVFTYASEGQYWNCILIISIAYLPSAALY